MSIYTYKAVDQNGNTISAEHEAQDRDAVASFLHTQGYVILSIDEKVDYVQEIFSGGVAKVALKNRVILAKQLATMLGAGLPLTQALEIMIQQTTDKSLKQNLTKVLEDIQRSGIQLSDAIEKNTKLFNEVQLSLLRAGESSGNLYEVLVKIAEDLDKSKRLQSKIQGAMIYPVIIFVVVAIVMAVMMIYMVPAVTDLYADMGKSQDELPGITKLLISISNFLSNPIGCSSSIIAVVFGVIGFRYYYSTPLGKSFMHKIFLRIPIFGKLISMIQIAEFSRLLSMLIKSGVPIIDSLGIVADALSNVHFKNALIEAKSEVANGVPLAVPLARSQVYPPLITRMVAIGEETGKLDSVLADMAKFYDEEVEEISDNLNKLMEPMILIIVGAVVAFLAIGIYMPIYSLGSTTGAA